MCHGYGIDLHTIGSGGNASVSTLTCRMACTRGFADGLTWELRQRSSLKCSPKLGQAVARCSVPNAGISALHLELLGALLQRQSHLVTMCANERKIFERPTLTSSSESQECKRHSTPWVNCGSVIRPAALCTRSPPEFRRRRDIPKIECDSPRSWCRRTKRTTSPANRM